MRKSEQLDRLSLIFLGCTIGVLAALIVPRPFNAIGIVVFSIAFVVTYWQSVFEKDKEKNERFN